MKRSTSPLSPEMKVPANSRGFPSTDGETAPGSRPFLDRARRYLDGGDRSSAASVCINTVRRFPNDPGVLHRAAVILHDAGRNRVSVDLLRRALRLAPRNEQLYNTLGIVLRDLSFLRRSETILREAIRLHPDSVRAHGNLGNVLRDLGRLEEAEHHHRLAVRMAPRMAIAHNSLGATLRDRMSNEPAIECFRRAVALDPAFSQARSNLAMMLLLTGRYPEGWRQYEYRATALGIDALMDTPRWRGEALRGETLLVICEQGLGDSIHFMRYLPLAAERGARVAFMCQPELVSLAAATGVCDEVIPDDRSPPSHDRYVPLLSLPGIFETNEASMPAPFIVPVDSQGAGFRRETVSHHHIGLCWAGSPVHTGDRKRSCGLPVLMPLTGVPDTRFYGLQKGQRGDELRDQLVPAGRDDRLVVDCSEFMTDFLASAAVIDQLDLVITVDTALAHLAGSMGKPVWLLLPYAPDWRWSVERSETGWYPGMRLFRQPSPGDWVGVVNKVRVALETLVATGEA